MARSTDIGSLNVRLVAVTSQFNKGLGSARNSLRTFSRVINTDVFAAVGRVFGVLSGGFINAITSIPRLVGAAISKLLQFAKVIGVTIVGAVTALIGAMGVLAVRSISSINAVGDAAEKLGVSVKSLTELKFAAAEAGVEFNQLETGLQRMIRRVSEAARGTGAAKDALKELGLDARQLLFLRPEDIFNRISQAIQKVTNQNDRLRLTVKIFDQEGANLVRLFASNIEDANKWAEILNVTVSDFDAAQIKEADKSVKRLKAAFEGVGNYLAAQLAPIIIGITDKALKMIAAQGGVAAIVGKAISAVAQIAVSTLNNIGRAMENVRGFAGDIGVDSSTPGEAIRSATDNMLILIATTKVLSAEFEKLWLGFKLRAIQAIDIVQGTYAEKLFRMFASPATFGMVKENPSAKEAAAVAIELQKQIIEIKQSIIDAQNEIDQITAGIATDAFSRVIGVVGGAAEKAVDKASSVFADGFVAIENTIKDIDVSKIESFLNDWKEFVSTPAVIDATLTDRAKAYFDLIRGDGPSERIKKLDEQIAKSSESVSAYADETQRIWARTIDSISDNLAGAIVRGENLFESLKNTALQVVEQMLSAFLKFLFIAPIFRAFGIPFGGGGGGGGGFLGGIFGGFSGAAPAINSASIATSGIQAGGAGMQDVTNINFYGPVAGEEAFMDMVNKGIRRKENTRYIQETSHGYTSQKFSRTMQPLAGS